MKPTLIQKRRYIVFKTITKIEKRDMLKKINESLSKFLGQYGSAKAGCSLVYFDGEWGILRAGVKEVDRVKSSLLFIEEINGKKMNIFLPYVGGTIKSAQKFIIEKGGR